MLACLALPQQATAQNSVMFENTGTMHTLSIADAEVMEGAGTADFVITLEPAIPDSIRLAVSYSAGTASLEDLGSSLRTSVFPTNTLTLQVPINDDSLVETAETFTVTLTRGIYSVSATGTIIDNDTASSDPTVSIAPVTVAENVSGGNAVFTATLSRAATTGVELNVAVAAGDTNPVTLADDLGDLTDLSNDGVTIAFGALSQTFMVPIIDDNLVEGNETFKVTISLGNNAGVTIGTGEVTGMITDDDMGEVTLDPPTLMAAENGTFEYTVSLDKAADEAVNVTWTASVESGDTAVVADDLRDTTGEVTFMANDTVDKTFTIRVNDDMDVEDAETFTVTLTPTDTLPTGVTIPSATSSSKATITDNDTASSDPTVSIAPVTVVENVSGGNAVFTATLSRAATTGVELNVAVAAGDTNPVTLADDLGDLTDLSNNGVTIAFGDLSQTFMVPIIDDNLVEGNETFKVTISLGNNAGVTIGTGTVTGTITDDDTASSDPTVSIAPVTVAENVSGGNAVFTATLSRAATTGVELNVAVAAGDTNPVTLADDLGDLTDLSNNGVTISFGDLSQTFMVPIIDDNLVEGNETFKVTISLGNNAGVTIGTGTVTGTITDDDTASSDPTVSIAPVTVVENVSGGVALIPVSMTPPRSVRTTLNISFAPSGNNPVTLADDLGTLPTQVVFLANEPRTNIEVPIIDDDFAEGGETFTVTLSRQFGSVPLIDGDGEATVTIADNESGPSLYLAPHPSRTQLVEEGGSFNYRVILDGDPSDEPIDLTWTASAGASHNDATVAEDLHESRGKVSFAPGDIASKTFTIRSVDDTEVEGNEFFTVTLTPASGPPAGVRISQNNNSSRAFILDNDGPAVTLEVVADVSEADRQLTFQPELVRPGGREFSLSWQVTGGTASAADFEDFASSGSMFIPRGGTAAPIRFTPIDDDDVEGPETLELTISLNIGTGLDVSIATARATATITDNDEPARLSIADARVVDEDVAGATADFTLSLTEPVDSDVTVRVGYTGGTATPTDDLGPGRPAAVTIPANRTTATLSVPITDDDIVEGAETFTVTLDEDPANRLPASVILSDIEATGTITEDDGALISLSPTGRTEITEGGSFTYTVRLSAPVDEAIDLTWSALGILVGVDDLEETHGTVRFAANDNADKTFTIRPVEDRIDEPNETFTVYIFPTGPPGLFRPSPFGDIGSLPARVMIDPNRNSAMATVADNDAAVMVRIADATVDEDMAGAAAVFTVSLDRAVDSDVALAVTYGAGSVDPATPANDLGADRPARVTIPADETSATVTVPILDDAIVEGAETFTVTVSEDPAKRLPADVIITDNQATGTITEDDRARLSLSPARLLAAEGGMFRYTVRLSAPVGEAFDVGWFSGAGVGDVEETRGTVRFEANDTADRTFTIRPVADELDEPHETFTVAIAPGSVVPPPAGVRIDYDNYSSTATILDGSAGAWVSIADARVDEDGGAVAFTVSLNRAVAGDVVFDVAYAAGSASLSDLLVGGPDRVTIDEGDTSTTFDVPVGDDELVEGDETFTVTLSETRAYPLPADMIILDGTATGTIRNDDTALVSVSPTTADRTTIAFRAGLSNPLTEALTLGWTATVESGAGTADPLSGTVTIRAGGRSAPITIDAVGLPSGGTLTVRLSDAGLPPGVRLDDRRDMATHQLRDLGRVSIANADPVAEGAGPARFTVSLSRAVADDVWLIVNYGHRSASWRDLGNPLPASVLIAKGKTSAVLSVPILDDDIVEGRESFTVTISEYPANRLPAGVTIADGTATGTITDEGGPVPVLVSLSPSPTREGTVIVFGVDLTNPLEADLALGWTATVEPGANPRDDRDPFSGTVTVPEGDLSAPLMIDTAGLSPGRFLTVRLSDADLPSGVLLDADGITSGDIIPATPAGDTATVSLSPRVTEERIAVVFTVNLSDPLREDLALGWTATEIPEFGADPDPSDPLSGTVTVEAGDTSAEIMISTLYLTVDATLVVRLSDAGLPPGVQIDADRNMTSYLIPGVRIASAASVAAVSIEDADPVAAGSGPVRFMVSLSQSVDSDVVLDVDYGVSNGAGLASLSDLGSARPASVMIAMGATEATLDVPIVVDDFAEDEETFTVTLTMHTAPDGVIIADGSATGTITQSRGPSVLVEPRRVRAGAALRRHVSRFDSMTGTVVRNRLRGSGMHDLSFSADVTEDRQDVTVSSQPFTGRWGTWIDGAWAGIDGNASGRQADIHAGVDYLGGDWLIGALIGYELADLDIGEGTFRSNTVQFGLYGGARLSEQLLFDGAFAYGTSTPEVGLGDVSGSYDAQRFTVRGALTGDFGLGTGQATGQGSSVRFEPQLGVLYSSETLGAFTDSADRMAKSETLEIGRLTAGPRVTRDFDGGQVTAGARIQWDFLGLDDGVDGKVSAAADIGLRFELAPGVTLGIHGDIDGIGIGDDFRSIGGRFELGVRF